AQTRVSPDSREPRTAVGVDATGRWLYLVVIDGRQPGWSGGMTLPQLADYMIALGCSDAVNLDGGGSSSFHAQSSDGEIFRNRPSDGVARPVFNHLAVFVKSAVQEAPRKGGDVE
ncbi:MAG: phosphodiester glycosidase family protein, partial [Planctomycetota bacterium]